MRPGDLLEQRYRLVRVLGRGRSGSVWCARNELIDRAVAVKVLHRSLASDPERLQRFFQEARACGRVRHPAVVEVLDLGQGEDGILFLVMELLEGETMASLLGRKGRLQTDEALALVIPLARGLAAAHAHGILHRDLKPANIYLHKTPTGGLQPKILDFGISKILGNDVTATGVVLGTPSYMSPEQARGVADLDPRTDVWSLGVIMYEALTGRLPFVAKEYRALVDEIIERKHVPVEQIAPEVPLEVCRVVDEALEKSRDRRLSSAAAMAQKLAAILRRKGRDDLLRDPDDEFSEGAPTLAQDRERLPPMTSAAIIDDTVGDHVGAPAVQVAMPKPASAVPTIKDPLSQLKDPPLSKSGSAPKPSAATLAIAAQTSGAKRLEKTPLPRPAAGTPARISKVPEPKSSTSASSEETKPENKPEETRPDPKPHPVSMKTTAERSADTTAKLVDAAKEIDAVISIGSVPADEDADDTKIETRPDLSQLDLKPSVNAPEPAKPVTTQNWELAAAQAASGRAEVILGSGLPPSASKLKVSEDWDTTVADVSANDMDKGAAPELANAPLPKLAPSPPPFTDPPPGAAQSTRPAAGRPPAKRSVPPLGIGMPKKDPPSIGPIPGFTTAAPTPATSPTAPSPLAAMPKRPSSRPPPRGMPSVPAQRISATLEAARVDATNAPIKKGPPRPPPKTIPPSAGVSRNTMRPPIDGFAAPAPVTSQPPPANAPLIAPELFNLGNDANATAAPFELVQPQQDPLLLSNGTPHDPHHHPSGNGLAAMSLDPAIEGRGAADETDRHRRVGQSIVPLMAAAVAVVFIFGALVGTFAASRRGGNHRVRRFLNTEALLIAWHDGNAQIEEDEAKEQADKIHEEKMKAAKAKAEAEAAAAASATASASAAPPAASSAPPIASTPKPAPVPTAKPAPTSKPPAPKPTTSKPTATSKPGTKPTTTKPAATSTSKPPASKDPPPKGKGEKEWWQKKF